MGRAYSGPCLTVLVKSKETVWYSSQHPPAPLQTQHASILLPPQASVAVEHLPPPPPYGQVQQSVVPVFKAARLAAKFGLWLCGCIISRINYFTIIVSEVKANWSAMLSFLTSLSFPSLSLGGLIVYLILLDFGHKNHHVLQFKQIVSI